MNRTWLVSALILTSPITARPDDPTPPAGEYKLQIRLHGVAKEPIATAEMMVRKGVAYQFLSESPDEVIVIEPGKSRVVLVNLDRKVQAEVSARQLDGNLGRLYETTLAAVERKEKSGTRSDRLTAAMSRDLIDPKFKVVNGPEPHRIRLTNPTVEATATTEDEPDLDRLAMIANCLAAIAKLGALRDPDAIPPFTRLAALRAVAAAGTQRPAELSYVYRLAGPPRKLRWTYRLVPELTDRERNAVVKLDAIRARTPLVSFADYEAGHPE